MRQHLHEAEQQHRLHLESVSALQTDNATLKGDVKVLLAEVDNLKLSMESKERGTAPYGVARTRGGGSHDMTDALIVSGVGSRCDVALCVCALCASCAQPWPT